MEVVCPGCGEKLEIPCDIEDGRHLQCFACNNKFTILKGQLFLLQKTCVVARNVRPIPATVCMWMLFAVVVYQLFRICYGLFDIATHDYGEATFKFGLALIVLWSFYGVINLWGANGYRIGSKVGVYLVTISVIIFAADVVIGLINWLSMGSNYGIKGLLNLVYYAVMFCVSRTNRLQDWLAKKPFWSFR